MSWDFEDLQQQVLVYMDDTTNDGNLLTNVKNSLNVANAQRCTEYPWKFMLATTSTTFTCTSASSYTLSTSVSKPLYFYNQTKREFVQIIPERGLRSTDFVSTDPTLDKNRAVLRGANQTLVFLQAPTVGDVISYHYYRLPALMSSASDLPDIPFPHSQVLAWDTLINMKAYVLEPDAIAVFQDNQQKALTSLYAAFGDHADIIGSEPEYFNVVDY